MQRPVLLAAMVNSRSTSHPDVTLRAARDNDREPLYRVFIASRDDLMVAIANLNVAQQETFLHLQFQARQQQYRSLYPNARFDVIVSEGKVIGNFYVAPADDEIRLVDINLLPGFRNRGIGCALLQDLIDESEHSNKPVSLQVMQGNPALRLYARLGFTAVGGEGVYRRMERQPSPSS